MIFYTAINDAILADQTVVAYSDTIGQVGYKDIF